MRGVGGGGAKKRDKKEAEAEKGVEPEKESRGQNFCAKPLSKLHQKKLHQSAPQKETLLKSPRKTPRKNPKNPLILPYALTEGLLPQIDKVAAYIFIFKNLFGKL